MYRDPDVWRDAASARVLALRGVFAIGARSLSLVLVGWRSPRDLLSALRGCLSSLYPHRTADCSRFRSRGVPHLAVGEQVGLPRSVWEGLDEVIGQESKTSTNSAVCIVDLVRTRKLCGHHRAHDVRRVDVLFSCGCVKFYPISAQPRGSRGPRRLRPRRDLSR